MVIIYKKILFLLFLICSSVLFAQVDQEKKTLTEILSQLQEKYDYQFTYADDVVINILINPPKDNQSFKEIINYLKRETGLVFQFLKNNFIAIKPYESTSYICGYVIDYETRTPLEAVTIIGKSNYTISDDFGYFKLKVTSDNENITIRHLGFYNQSILAYSFDKENCTNIFLIPEIETLSEIVLTNFIAKGIDKVSDGSVNINFLNFGILPGLIETDVLQTIQALPGVQSVNETISNINIRGGTNDQNLLLWDGIKMYQSGHFFGLISIFNPLITTDVSVYKNGTSVDFTDGVSGTIAMKSNNSINTAFTGSIGINFINTDGFADIPLGEKSSLQLSARKAINDFIEDTPTYTNYFNRITQNTEINPLVDTDITFDFYDTSIRWLYNITEKDKLRLNFINVNNELVFNEIATVNGNEESRQSGLIQNTIAEGLWYKRTWNSNVATTVQVYETDYKLKAINSDIIQQQRLLQENKVSETSVKINTWYKYNNNLSFLNGYQFIENGITNVTNVDNPPFKRFRREVIREHALYSQANYVTNEKKTNIKAGVRYNYIEKFKKHIIEPRFSVNHTFFKQLSVEILGEIKHQNTSQIINFQNDFLGVEKRRWRLANNKDIPVITSKQISLGFNFSHKGWLLNTEGFYKKVDGITSQSQGFVNQYIFTKAIGSYRVSGIDFIINKRLRHFNTWLSYTYQDNEYTFNDLQEINFPNNLDITHAVSFGTSFTKGNFKISAGFNWHTGKPSTKPVSGNEIINGTLNFEDANSSNLEEYMRVDLSATYKFNLGQHIRIHTGVSVWNVLSEENILSNFYSINNNQAINNELTSLKRTPNFTFRVEFN